MKKFLLPILMMAMVSLVACGGDDNDTPNPPEKKSLKLTKMITNYKDIDSEGKSILTVFYGKNGFVSKITSPESYKKTFTYNDKDQLKKETETFQEKGKEVTKITTYTYNEKGLLVTKIENANSENPDKTIYEYNDKNLLAKRIRNADSKYPSVDICEYDTNGQLKKLRYYNNKYENIIVYAFDTKKNPNSILFPKEYRLTDPQLMGNHNCLSETDNKWYKYEVDYTYNKEGYPKKVVNKHFSEGKNDITETTEYFYE